MNRSFRFLLLALLGAMLFLPGCSLLRKQQAGTDVTGNGVKITVEIPQTRGALGDMELDEVLVTLTKDGQSPVTGTTRMEGGTATLQLGNLAVGEWNVAVRINDKAGYGVYEGNNKVVVYSDKVTPVTVKMLPLPADLDVSVVIPQDLGVVSGSITLMGPAGLNQTGAITIDGTTGRASFTGLKTTTWSMAIRLFNADGKTVAAGESQMDVMPGRMNTSTVTLRDGSAYVNVTWDLEPLAPQGLVSNQEQGTVVLNWNPSTQLNIAGYAVYRSNSPDGQKRRLNSALVTGTTYTDSDVELLKPYYYWVQAYDTNGLSSKYSNMTGLVVSLAGNTVVQPVWF